MAPDSHVLIATSEDVATFWRDAGPKRWFAKNAAFDADFKARFEATYEAAAAGRCNDWADSADGTFALLVLLDQFPRNAYRHSPLKFATDAKARGLVLGAIDAGHDRTIESTLRPFFYLPLMHSESLADQDLSVRLNSELDANTQRFARNHRDIVARFGRFPHRNALLGRTSTPEEIDFLRDGGFKG